MQMHGLALDSGEFIPAEELNQERPIMTNQQAPEIYALHTVPNKGERPWSGIYTVRADAEHDAKVLRLVVADTATTPTGPVARYKIGYHTDDWGVRSLSPTGIYDDAGPWVRYEDHVAVIAALGTQPAPATQQPEGDVVAYLDIGASGYLDLGAALSEDALQQLPKGRHALVIAGTYGIDGYVAASQPSPTAQADSQQAGVVRKIDRGFRWDGENLQHVPTLLLEFEPVPANSPCDAKGWQDRDAVADRLSSRTAQAAESVLEDAARLDFLIEQRAYVVSDPDACPGYWLHFVHKETGKCWAQVDEHPTPRAAIDAARKQGANHD